MIIELPQDRGNRDLESAHTRKIRVYTRIQEKGAVTPQEADLELPMCVQRVSGRGVGWQWPGEGSRALSVAVPAWDLLKEVAIIFITSTTVWPLAAQR